MGINFVETVPDPSPRGRKKGRLGPKQRKYARYAKELKKAPGRWALIESVQGLKRVSYARKLAKQYGLTAVVRISKNHWYRVYVCYQPTEAIVSD